MRYNRSARSTCDTGGLCRECQKTIPKRVEVSDLVACMKGNDKRYRGVYFDNYCKRKPSVDALPILRRRALLQMMTTLQNALQCLSQTEGERKTGDL